MAKYYLLLTNSTALSADCNKRTIREMREKGFTFFCNTTKSFVSFNNSSVAGGRSTHQQGIHGLVSQSTAPPSHCPFMRSLHSQCLHCIKWTKEDIRNKETQKQTKEPELTNFTQSRSYFERLISVQTLGFLSGTFSHNHMNTFSVHGV